MDTIWTKKVVIISMCFIGLLTVGVRREPFDPAAVFEDCRGI